MSFCIPQVVNQAVRELKVNPHSKSKGKVEAAGEFKILLVGKIIKGLCVPISSEIIRKQVRRRNELGIKGQPFIGCIRQTNLSVSPQLKLLSIIAVNVNERRGEHK